MKIKDDENFEVFAHLKKQEVLQEGTFLIVVPLWVSEYTRIAGYALRDAETPCGFGVASPTMPREESLDESIHTPEMTTPSHATLGSLYVLFVFTHTQLKGQSTL